eukprot:Platyproteum_vivax@DN14448_c0_g1_i1.p1
MSDLLAKAAIIFCLAAPKLCLYYKIGSELWAFSEKKEAPAVTDSPTTCLLVVDHGSNLKEAQKVVFDIVDQIQKKLPNVLVRACHMGVCAPKVPETLDEILKSGTIKKLIVVPYFLAPGRHAAEDIPKMVEIKMAHYSMVDWTVTDCLGTDSRLGDVVLDKAGL